MEKLMNDLHLNYQAAIADDDGDDRHNSFFYATMCHVCKRFGDRVPLKRCGGCRMIAYCSREHQKQHWTQHKSICKAIRDVLQNHTMKYRDASSEEWVALKLNFMLLVTFKLERRMETYEMQMFHFPRECVVCHEWNGQLLEDCQSCLAVSFCKDHKEHRVKHKDICVSLTLSLHMDLALLSEEYQHLHLDLHYWQHISDVKTFQDMEDFINTYANIQIQSGMSSAILASKHSEYLTRPLTLFHAMRMLDYVPKCKDLVIHVIGASRIEEVTLESWEVLLHLIRPVRSLVVIMIGPELEIKSCPLHVCKNCTLREKKMSLEFNNVLYEEYARSPSFVKPDLVVGYNTGVHIRELGSPQETWAPSIRILAELNCPSIFTSLMRQEVEADINRINAILDKKPDYIYSGKNPFANLTPRRVLMPEEVSYQNYYVTVYRSLCQ